MIEYTEGFYTFYVHILTNKAELFYRKLYHRTLSHSVGISLIAI